MNVRARAPKSEHARSTRPTTTARSVIRRVSRNVFAARIASAPKKINPIASSVHAAGERASGTPGRAAAREPRAGLTDRTIATTTIRDEAEQDGDRPAIVDDGEGRERQNRGADRERGGARERNHAVLSDEHTGSDEPVHREDRGHDREPACDHDRAGVATTRADGHQDERRRRGGQGADADAVEVHPQGRHDHHATEQPEPENGDQRHPGEEANPGDRHAESHPSHIDRIEAELKPARATEVLQP